MTKGDKEGTSEDGGIMEREAEEKAGVSKTMADLGEGPTQSTADPAAKTPNGTTPSGASGVLSTLRLGERVWAARNPASSSSLWLLIDGANRGPSDRFVTQIARGGGDRQRDRDLKKGPQPGRGGYAGSCSADASSSQFHPTR